MEEHTRPSGWGGPRASCLMPQNLRVFIFEHFPYHHHLGNKADIIIVIKVPIKSGRIVIPIQLTVLRLVRNKFIYLESTFVKIIM